MKNYYKTHVLHRAIISAVRSNQTVAIQHLFSIDLPKKSKKKIISLVNSSENWEHTKTVVLHKMETPLPGVSTWAHIVHVDACIYILQRQREGIAIAKSNGVYKGRKPIQPP